MKSYRNLVFAIIVDEIHYCNIIRLMQVSQLGYHPLNDWLKKM
ncbi:hypothetical protein N9F27_03540 [Crocinitomicaceae bacterium]|nr:hypothetical protein [Crocinitomicaceae bacterium]